MAETDEERKPIFVAVTQADGSKVLQPMKMAKQERTLRSFQLPAMLYRRALLTQRDLDAHGWTEAEDNKIMKVALPDSGTYGYVCKITFAKLHELGLSGRFIKVRDMQLEKDVAQAFEDLMGATYKKEKGTAYEIGVSRQPNYGPSAPQMSPLARANIKDCNYIHNEILAITNEAMLRMMPDTAGSVHGRDQHFHQASSMTMGCAENRITSSLRVNFSRPNTGKGEFKNALKEFSEAHNDFGDSPTGFTGLANFSHLPDSQFKGRFNILPIEVTSTLQTGDILVFSVRLRHGASGEGPYDVPVGDPRRLPASPLDTLLAVPDDTPHMRIMGVAYPNHRYMNPKFEWLNTEIFSKSFKGLYDTATAYQDWMCRFPISHQNQVTYWNKKADDAGVQMIDVARGIDGMSPALLQRASKFCIQTIKAEIDAAKPPKVKKARKPRAKKGSTVVQPAAEVSVVKAKRVRKKYVPRPPIVYPKVSRYSAEYYQKLFIFEDSETGVVSMPDLAICQRSLEVVGKDNEAYKKLSEAMQALDCGASKRSTNRKRDEETGEEVEIAPPPIPIITHLEYEHTFDPLTDIVLGNPDRM